LNIIIVNLIVNVLLCFIADLAHGHASFLIEPACVSFGRKDTAIDAIINGIRDIGDLRTGGSEPGYH
jgi:hypothetical protein